VRDPTAYVTSSLRRVSGNDASPHSIQFFKPEDMEVVKVDPNADPVIQALQWQLAQAKQLVPGAVQTQQAALQAQKEKEDEEDIPAWLPPGQAAMLRRKLAERKAAGILPKDEPQSMMMMKQMGLNPVEDQGEGNSWKHHEVTMTMRFQVQLIFQHCEEQANQATSACSVARVIGEKHDELEVLTQQANTAAQRAAWAVGWVESTYPAHETTGAENAMWLATMREHVKQSTAKAAEAAQACIQQVCELKNRVGLIDNSGNRVKIKVKLKTCHAWDRQRSCRNGKMCTFAHGDHEIGTPQPILPDRSNVLPLKKE